MTKVKTFFEFTKDCQTISDLGSYGIIPDYLFDNFTTNQYIVYKYLHRHAAYSNYKYTVFGKNVEVDLKRGEVFSFVGAIVKKVDLSEKIVRNCIDFLIETGYVSKRTLISKGKNIGTIFTLPIFEFYKEPAFEKRAMEKAVEKGKGKPSKIKAFGKSGAMEKGNGLGQTVNSKKEKLLIKKESSSTTTSKNHSKAKINDATYALFLEFKKEALSRRFLKFVANDLQEPIETFFELKPYVEELFKYIEYRIDYFIRKERIKREEAIRFALTGLMDSYEEYCKDLVSSW